MAFGDAEGDPFVSIRVDSWLQNHITRFLVNPIHGEEPTRLSLRGVTVPFCVSKFQVFQACKAVQNRFVETFLL